MPGYQIWTDSEHNRLHLVIRRALSQPEVEVACLRVRSAVERLRPGFSITVQHELAEEDWEDRAPAAAPPDRLAIVRLQRHVDHILEAALPALVA
jgi:hypothetical protein